MEFEARSFHFLCFPHVAKVALPVSGAGKHCSAAKHTRVVKHTYTHMPAVQKHAVGAGINVFWQ